MITYRAQAEARHAERERVAAAKQAEQDRAAAAARGEVASLQQQLQAANAAADAARRGEAAAKQAAAAAQVELTALRQCALKCTHNTLCQCVLNAKGVHRD